MTYKITKTINGHTETLPHRIHNDQGGKVVLEDIRKQQLAAGRKVSYDGVGLYTDSATYKIVRE